MTVDDEAARDARRRKFADWLAQLPEHVRNVALSLPNYDPETSRPICYRHAENPRWHFTIGAYSTSDPVTVTLIHGRDSTLPGVAGFGQDPANLRPCHCGQWLPPTDSQTKFVQRRLKAVARRSKS